MEKITKIRNRISKTESKNKILNFFSLIMVILSICLGIMIYAKKDENGAFLKENFGVSYNFSEFNMKANSIINDLFKFDLSKNDKNDEQVNNQVTYIELGQNLFSSGSTSIEMMHNGIILGVYKDEYTYSLLVNYENGVLASYSNLLDVNVKQYDELDKGEVIGSYEESFKVLFKKDNKIISYNEAI